MNYSLLVMETAGMMKMASGDNSPPTAGCRKRAVDEIVEVQRLAAAEWKFYGYFWGFLYL